MSYGVIPQQKDTRSEEHTSELQSRQYLVCRLLLEKKGRFSTAVTPRGGCKMGKGIAIWAAAWTMGPVPPAPVEKCIVFFLMRRPPRGSTLFPNPTPSR